MGKEFLHDLNIHGAGQIQFKNTAGSNAGKIDQSGNDLVLSNAVGDIIIGNGSDDVFIGDGTNTVDIRFEQNMAIFADSSSTRTLTLGGANTSLVLESPTINGSLSLNATTINQNLIFTTANGHIVFDHETTDTGEYGTEVALLKIDVAGTEKTILSRVSKQGALALGTDDTVAIVAGDTKSVIKDNHNYAAENIVFASEGGFIAYGFPNNDTTWSNRNVFKFHAFDTTASNNGLYIGDGGQTQFIDLNRNLVNIGNITLTGDISTPGQINLPGDGASSFETLIYAHGSRGKLMKQGNAVFWQVAHGGNQFEITDCANDNSAKGNVLLRVSGLDADDNKLMLVPDGGSVGIGTTSPYAKLHITGADSTASAIRQSRTGTVIWDQAIDSSGRLQWGTRASEGGTRSVHFTLDDNGKVGIGTTSPNRLLQVKDTSGTASIAITSANTGTAQLELGGTSDNDIAGISYNNSTQKLFLKTNNTAQLYIDNSGNVGIGTDSPERVLSVTASEIVSSVIRGTNPTGHLIDLRHTNAADGYNGFRFYDEDTNRMNITHIQTGTRGYIQIGNDWASGSEIFVVDGDNKRVGIGTATPSRKLTIAQSADANGLQILGHDDRSTSGIELNVDASGHARLSQTTADSSGYLFLQAENYLQLIAGTFTYTQNPFRIYDNTQLQFGNSADYKISHITSNDNLVIHTDDNKGITIDNAGNTTFSDNVTIEGNLNITGDINSYNVTDLDVTDKTITVGVGQVAANSGSSGLIIDRSDSTNPSMLWNQTAGRFEFNSGVNVTGELHTTSSVSAKGSLFVVDTDGTNNHIQARSNGTEGFLTVSNGSNWGFIVRGPGNDPRIGAYHGGTLKIEGFHSSDGSTGANAIDFAQFQFGNSHFQMNASTSTFAGTIGSGAITSTGKITGTELEGTSLDINGNADISGNVTIQGASHNVSVSSGTNIRGSNHLFLQGDASYVQIKSPNNYIYYDAVSHNFRKEDGTANRLVIDATDATFSGNVKLNSNSTVVAARKFTARDANGVMLTADDATSGLSIADNGNATFSGTITSGNITATGSGNTALSVISTGGYSQLVTQSSDSDSAYIFFKDTSGERARLYSSTSNDLIFKTGGGSTTALTLNNSGNATFAGDVLPGTDNSKDLGSSSYRWQNVVAVNLHGDGSNITNVGNADTVDNLHASSFLRSDGSDTANGKITFSQNAATIALAGTNHTYIEYYKTGTGNDRSAYLGFGSSGNNHFNIANQISSGKVIIDTNGGSVEINDNTTFASDVTVNGGDIYLALSGSTQRAVSSTGTNSMQIGDAGTQMLRFKNAAGNSLDIAASGDATFANNVTVSGTLTVAGDLNITGDIDSYNVNNLDVVDKLITVGKGQTEQNSNGSGILVDGSNASLLWDESNNTWDFNKSLDVVGNITASGTVYIPSKLEHTGDSDTFLNFSDNTVTLTAGGNSTIFAGSGNATFPGNITTSGNVAVGNDLYVPNEIYHTGDTDTSIRFPAEDQFRVVTGGGNRLQVENTKIQVGDDVNMNYDNISTSNSGTVVYGGFLNPASEANMVHIPHIINDLAGFDKWSNATITTSGFYKTRSGSSGSYTYSNEVQANDSGWAKAFDAHSSTAGSWYSDNGSDGVYTHGTDTPGVVELEWTNEAQYSLWAGIVFGSNSFTATYVKIEAYRGGAWQTLCEITNNTDQVILRQVNGNSGTGSATTRLKYTLGGSVNGNYFRIHSLYMANYRAGDNNLNNTGTNTTRGVNFLERYKDGYLHGHLFPGADDTYDLGGNSYKWKNAYFDGVVYADRVQSEGAFPQYNIIDTPNGGGSSRTMQLGMSGSTLYFKKSDATGSVIFRNTNNTNLMTIGLADTGQVTVLNELEAGSLDINGNADISGTSTFGGNVEIGTNNLNFADNGKARFGNSTDLQIYHDSGNSYINDTGTGSLILKGNSIKVNDDGDGNATFQVDASGDIGLKVETGSANYIFGDSAQLGTGNFLEVQGGDSFDFKLFDSGTTTTKFQINPAGGFTRHKDNVIANFGDGNDLQIMHTSVGISSNSFINNDTGDLTIRNTANDKDIILQSDNGSGGTTTYVKADGSTGAVELFYYGTKKFETTSSGISVTNGITLGGTVQARTIPYVIHTGWGDDTPSTGNLIVPLGNSVTDTSVSQADGFHFFVAPYNGKVQKIIMKNVAGSLSSSFTTELKLYVNGANVTSSGELTASSDAITWEPSSSNTFSAADEISIVYQKSASSKYWREVSLTMVLTMNGQDI